MVAPPILSEKNNLRQFKHSKLNANLRKSFSSKLLNSKVLYLNNTCVCIFKVCSSGGATSLSAEILGDKLGTLRVQCQYIENSSFHKPLNRILIY